MISEIMTSEGKYFKAYKYGATITTTKKSKVYQQTILSAPQVSTTQPIASGFTLLGTVLVGNKAYYLAKHDVGYIMVDLGNGALSAIQVNNNNDIFLIAIDGNYTIN